MWSRKAGHKKHCIAKADRVPQHQDSSNAHKVSDSGVLEEECAICLNPMSGESATTLPCSHAFHGTCVAELRKFGVKQACPLCRTPLTPGPEKSFDEAMRRYMMVFQLVLRGFATWDNLPASAQRDMDAAIKGWRAAANEGYALAQFTLANIVEHGCGVAKNDAEAARWYRKAAMQGDAQAQCCLGLILAKEPARHTETRRQLSGS